MLFRSSTIIGEPHGHLHRCLDDGRIGSPICAGHGADGEWAGGRRKLVEVKGNRPKGIAISVTGSVAAAPERLQHSEADQDPRVVLCTGHINHQDMNESRKCLPSYAYRVGASV